MKKSLNLFIVIFLLTNVFVDGQVYQIEELLAVEDKNFYSSYFKELMELEETVTPDWDKELIEKDKKKNYSNTKLISSIDLPILLEEALSIEQNMSLKNSIPDDRLKPLSLVDTQKKLHLRLITPNVTTNRRLKSFGPVYEF